MNLRSAVSKVDKNGMLLVFPLANRQEPASLWSEFYPRTKMRWEWDQDGDTRVSDLWHLREQLSKSDKVVYTKWFRGRATLISRNLFPALLKVLGTVENEQGSRAQLNFQAREVLDLLEEDSPLSTKQIKRQSGLSGKVMEREYERALKSLWSRLLIVGYGEVDEGAFPSLAIGSTRVLFEDLWSEALKMEIDEAWERVNVSLEEGLPFRKYLQQLLRDFKVRSTEESEV